MNKQGWGKRWMVKVGIVATVAATWWGGLAKAGATATNEVNVRDFGAVGNGVTNDTAAIQRANDAVSAKGGGRVVFPAGVYIAGGVLQDSYVEFFGGRDSVLKHPNGVSPSAIVKSRRFALSGTIVAGSRTLHMSSTSKIRPGAEVAILGASQPSPVRYLYARATSIGAGQLTLDVPAAWTVRNATVYVGSVNLSIRGLTFDGNRVTDGTKTATNAIPVAYELARWGKVSDTLIHNGGRGAIAFDLGTVDSVAENNVLRNNGRVDLETGSAVWVFHGSSRNIIRNNIIDGVSYQGVFVDDRTVTATEWDAPSNDNVVENNVVDIAPVNGHCGIQIAGSERNTIRYNTLSRLNRGICVSKSGQSQPHVDARYNTAYGNKLSNHLVGIEVTGSSNTFADNLIARSQLAVRDTGSNNTFN